MRITIEVDDKTISEITKSIGIRKKSPAIRHALEEYAHDVGRKRFLKKVLDGKSDYSLTNEEIEAQGKYDAD